MPTYAISVAPVFRLLLALLVGGCSVSLDLTPRLQPLVEETVEGDGPDKILLIDLSGVLSDEVVALSLTTPPARVPLAARVREELHKAEKDDRIRGLIVRINSPGGTITASDIVYQEIKSFRDRKKVPVIAAIMDVGASGGYYAALAADKILAHPTTVTGSIGVIMVTVNAQGLLEKIGVATLPIKSGAFKDAGSPFRPMTAEERAIFQSVVDDLQARFVRLIVQSRHLPEERVRAAADGRIYTADQALALGLIDRIGYLEDAVAMAMEAASLGEASVVMYRRPRDYRSNFYSTAPVADEGFAQVARLIGAGGPRFLYLWWP
ncbi:MAG TPA: signal peptide peptidase SppA [Candidatus Binatia bacterium]|nr:signal peptide peptidase SppA [Candidatus Binatia bacterium]